MNRFFLLRELEIRNKRGKLDCALVKNVAAKTKIDLKHLHQGTNKLIFHYVKMFAVRFFAGREKKDENVFSRECEHDKRAVFCKWNRSKACNVCGVVTSFAQDTRIHLLSH